MAVLDELREGGRLVALLCLSAFVSLLPADKDVCSPGVSH
jgi:hypothetical protein